MYRGALSEMVVPYGDPGRRLVFPQYASMPESWGWGFSRARCGREWIARRTARYSTPWWPRNRVSRGPFRRAVGVVRARRQASPGSMATTRGARATWCCSFLSEAGNYEYGFDWIFHQDGALEMRVALTGIMSVKAVAEGAHDTYEPHGGKKRPAMHHQHFFTSGWTWMWMALPNRVVEMNSAAVPAGQAESVWRRVHHAGDAAHDGAQAQRKISLESSRRWIVQSPAVKNALGQPTGFALLPGENAVPYLLPDGGCGSAPDS